MRSHATLGAIGFAVLQLSCLLIGCGRSEVEETQREWLVDQHAMEKRMVAVRARHLALQRAANTAEPPVAQRAVELLRANDATLRRIELMVDQHSLERQSGVDADDPVRTRRGHASARVAYESAGAALDSIESRNGQVAVLLPRVQPGPGDTAGLQR